MEMRFRRCFCLGGKNNVLLVATRIRCSTIGKEQTKTATELAYAEVISYNRKNLERELQNESRQHNRQQSRTKRREKEI